VFLPAPVTLNLPALLQTRVRVDPQQSSHHPFAPQQSATFPLSARQRAQSRLLSALSASTARRRKESNATPVSPTSSGSAETPPTPTTVIAPAKAAPISPTRRRARTIFQDMHFLRRNPAESISGSSHPGTLGRIRGDSTPLAGDRATIGRGVFEHPKDGSAQTGSSPNAPSPAGGSGSQAKPSTPHRGSGQLPSLEQISRRLDSARTISGVTAAPSSGMGAPHAVQNSADRTRATARHSRSVSSPISPTIVSTMFQDNMQSRHRQGGWSEIVPSPLTYLQGRHHNPSTPVKDIAASDEASTSSQGTTSPSSPTITLTPSQSAPLPPSRPQFLRQHASITPQQQHQNQHQQFGNIEVNLIPPTPLIPPPHFRRGPPPSPMLLQTPPFQVAPGQHKMAQAQAQAQAQAEAFWNAWMMAASAAVHSDPSANAGADVFGPTTFHGSGLVFAPVPPGTGPHHAGFGMMSPRSDHQHQGMAGWGSAAGVGSPNQPVLKKKDRYRHAKSESSMCGSSPDGFAPGMQGWSNYRPPHLKTSPASQKKELLAVPSASPEHPHTPVHQALYAPPSSYASALAGVGAYMPVTPMPTRRQQGMPLSSAGARPIIIMAPPKRPVPSFGEALDAMLSPGAGHGPLGFHQDDHALPPLAEHPATKASSGQAREFPNPSELMLQEIEGSDESTTEEEEDVPIIPVRLQQHRASFAAMHSPGPAHLDRTRTVRCGSLPAADARMMMPQQPHLASLVRRASRRSSVESVPTTMPPIAARPKHASHRRNKSDSQAEIKTGTGSKDHAHAAEETETETETEAQSLQLYASSLRSQRAGSLPLTAIGRGSGRTADHVWIQPA